MLLDPQLKPMVDPCGHSVSVSHLVDNILLLGSGATNNLLGLKEHCSFSVNDNYDVFTYKLSITPCSHATSC